MFHSNSSRARLLTRLRCVQGLHSLVWPQIISFFPQPGSRPLPPAVEAQSPHPWTTKGSPSGNLLMSCSGSFNLASEGLLRNEGCWPLPFVGGLSSAEELRDAVSPVPGGRTSRLPQGGAILAVPPLSHRLLPSLISKSWKLPFGTQGRSWRLEPVPTNKKPETWAPVPRSPAGSCSSSG